MSKANLRREFQQPRSKDSATKQQLLENVKALVHDLEAVAPQIAFYRAKDDEAPCELTPLENYYFPMVRGEDLAFWRPKSAQGFRLSSWSILEPIEEQSTPLDFNQACAVFCPAVALDEGGMRIGRGKGFYDRFFADHPEVLRVGVVYHDQISARPIPAEDWDQAVDWIVTEQMILRTSQVRSLTPWT